MLIRRLAHVCLNVTDLQRSLAFYKKLGLKERFDFTRRGRDFGRYLEISEKNYLELFEEPRQGAVINNGLAHFCLETEDLPALMAHLNAQGVAFTPKKVGPDHTAQIWLEDPDGNRFEVHEYTPQSMQLVGGSVEADW